MGNRTPNSPSREITPEAIYLRRREFLLDSLRFVATAGVVGAPLVWLMRRGRAGGAKNVVTPPPLDSHSSLTIVSRETSGLTESQTPFADVTTYNNFYELGTGKGDPAENAHSLRSQP